MSYPKASTHPYPEPHTNRNPVLCEVRRSSKSWRQRDKKLQELVQSIFRDNDPTDYAATPNMCLDLDENATTYVLVDRINAKKDEFDSGPAGMLTRELIRYLSSQLPSLALKTGWTAKYPFGVAYASALSACSDSAMSGTPTLFLDARLRSMIQAPMRNRALLIEEAKKIFSATCDELLAVGLADNFDAGALAYFHDALFHDGNPHTVEFESNKGRITYRDGSTGRTLHEAVCQKKNPNFKSLS